MHLPSILWTLALVAVLVLLFIAAFVQVQRLMQAQVPGLPSGISARETCSENPEGSACWMQMDDQPGCYYWNSRLEVNETVTWSGTCSGGLAEGDGEIKWVYGKDQENSTTATGRFQQGKMDGPWVTRHPNGTVGEGPYADGKRDGQWVFNDADGNVMEGPYVDDKQHGQWVEHHADGNVIEGPYADGKRDGQWVERHADGILVEGPYADGKRDGQWVERNPLGIVYEGPFVNGKRDGKWIVHWFNVRVITLIWLNGILMDVDLW